MAHKDENPWVEHLQKRPYEELYDLENDPNEMKNLAHIKKYKKQLKVLSQELDKWMNAQNDFGMDSEMKVPLKSMKRKKNKRNMK
ncbi:MAG: hypothetical protein MI922_06715 [Bacteroidales bacterium]|nr:hypothetical protein [Bacteroidales bacterium]